MVIVNEGSFNDSSDIKPIPRAKNESWSKIPDDDAIPMIEYGLHGTSSLKAVMFDPLP